MVIVHPEYAMLVLEVNRLQEQIANLIVERDMLNFYVCRDIEIDYMLKIGALEYKLMVAGNQYRKNARRLELINEKLAQKVAVNLSAINRKINVEFKEKDKLESRMSHNIDVAIEIASLEGYDYDSIDEMNVDYFKVQKLYNPIFDLEISEEKEKLYSKIEKYYEKGNYKKLHKLAEEYDEDDILQDEFSNLKELKEKYVIIFEKVQKQVRKIKNTYPYNQKVILEDENLCRRKKDSLNREIIEVNTENKKLEKKIQDKLKKSPK